MPGQTRAQKWQVIVFHCFKNMDQGLMCLFLQNKKICVDLRHNNNNTDILIWPMKDALSDQSLTFHNLFLTPHCCSVPSYWSLIVSRAVRPTSIPPCMRGDA